MAHSDAPSAHARLRLYPPHAGTMQHPAITHQVLRFVLDALARCYVAHAPPDVPPSRITDVLAPLAPPSEPQPRRLFGAQVATAAATKL